MPHVPYVDVFPEFHAWVLDIGVNLFLVRDFLQDDAVELPHSGEPKNKDGPVAVKIVVALRKQVGQRQEFGFLVGALYRGLEGPGQQRFAAVIVE